MPNEDLSCAELRGAIRRLKAQSSSLMARLGRATSRERESILIQIDDVQSELADDEAQAGIRGCNPPFSASLRWQSAPGFAIQRTTAPMTDHAAGPYHAGRVNDILALPAGSALAGSVLIGADTGGVWLHNPDGGTFPLSDGWDDPDVVCLAQGPHSDT